jgi:hypothetical protein
MSFRMRRRFSALCLFLAAVGSCPRLNGEPGSSPTPPVRTPEKLRELEVPDNFLDQIAKDGSTLRFTLPDGHPVLGKIASVERDSAGLTRIEGGIQHPDAGTFRFTRTGSRVEGNLRISGKPTEWKVTASGKVGVRPKLVEVAIQTPAAPPEDAFRPKEMVMPTAPPKTVDAGAAGREAAEASLRKDLKIEKLESGKLRIGEVNLDPTTRSIRFPAKMNLREGAVEYAVTTATGKTHESAFTTTASPRDVHVALLLLGVKPAPCGGNPDHILAVPAEAAVRVTLEWEIEGKLESHAIQELITLTEPAGTRLPDRFWLYNGSRFNEAGFAATLDGSIISLIADDLALINNSGADRGDDQSHVPNTALLPPTGTPVTVQITLSKPSPASDRTPR